MASIAQPRVQAPALPKPRVEESGLWSWLTTVDHKRIAKLYGVSAFVFFLLGGLEAMLIRSQLTRPENNVVDAQRYNELFTMHGTTMIFLVVMPLSVAFFNLVVPLQIGARDVAFPRLNGFSYWTFLAGATILYIPVLFSLPGIFARIAAGALNSLLGLPILNGLQPWLDAHLPFATFVPDQGWYGYAPLTQSLFSGREIDFWALGLQILGVASMAGAFNFIVTIINLRAPGMSMMRMPIFSWSTLITSVLIIMAFPAITIPGAPDVRPTRRYPLLPGVQRGRWHPGHRRRRPDALAAPLLDLRPSRGLHPDPASLRSGFGDHPGLRSQTALRLRGHGLRHRRHCFPRLRRLGPSHVHHRPWPHTGLGLLGGHDAHRHSNRGEDPQLDGDDVGRVVEIHNADALRRRSRLTVRDRRTLRRHALGRTGRYPAE